jgi:hypothetical protein
MTDDRLLAVIYGLCLLLWVGSSQIADPRTRRLARNGAYALLAIGLALALFRFLQWLAG